MTNEVAESGTKEVEEQKGKCPECEAELEYKDKDFIGDGDGVGRECYCSNTDCGWEGVEWYLLKFDGYTKTN